MAYQTGSATDLGDLLSKLDIFMVANGWTQDDFDDGATTAAQGFAQWNKNSMHVGLKWVANLPNNMSIHQALGNAGAVFPGAHTDDSGNGYNSAFGADTSLDDERCVNDIGDGPFVSYHFFEQDSGPAYVHVVVEISSETFRHFGWGEMEKFNDWTGGEYCYGHFADESINSSGVDTGATTLFDGQNSVSSATGRRSTTIHAEGLPHQGVNEKWLHHAGAVGADDVDFNDTAGETKRLAFGGFRAGPIAMPMGQFRSDLATGHIPMYPLAIFTRDFTNQFVYFLGNVPDIRGVDMFNFAAGQEVTIGSDTWVLFPQVRRTEDNIVGRTYYSGIAYKKVTA
tara:strand:- start:25303 stop:26322 length:1020 start_codon:yes stop_codon:yes gene_type:complete